MAGEGGVYLRWSISALLNYVYALMVEGADEKGREKFDSLLSAPLEGSPEARAADRRARFELAQRGGALG